MRTRVWIGSAACVIVLGVVAVGLRPADKADGLNERNAGPAPVLQPTAAPLRILVTGGTSGIGLAVTRLAASRGHRVTVMARHCPANQPSAERFIAGDNLDPEAVAAAVRDQDAVVTGIGAGDSRGHGGLGYDHVFLPLLMQGMYEDTTREEAEIRERGLEWTIVRPGFLDNAPVSLHYRVVEHLDGVTSGTISRADVAHFIVAVLEQPRYVRGTVLLTN